MRWAAPEIHVHLVRLEGECLLAARVGYTFRYTYRTGYRTRERSHMHPEAAPDDKRSNGSRI
jgi:hypothetical protein